MIMLNNSITFKKEGSRLKKKEFLVLVLYTGVTSPETLFMLLDRSKTRKVYNQ